MPKHALSIFLTFVLSSPCFVPRLAFAASNAPDQMLELEQDAPDAPNRADQDALESVTITPPPPGPTKVPTVAPEFFYSFRHELTARLGAVLDGTSQTPRSLVGVQYHFLHHLKAYEAGADMLSDGTGALHISRKFIYTRTMLRPYTKAGLGLRIVPQDQLVTALRFQHYQLRGAAGFEWMFRLAMSARLELETAISGQGLQAGVIIGYVWAW
jgi:hypothetical protein